MEIQNTTKAPLRVPLPGGKKLHLGPAGKGNVTPKALEHPPVKKLIEAGQLEVTGSGRSQAQGAANRPAAPGGSQTGGGGAGGVRHTGDR